MAEELELGNLTEQAVSDALADPPPELAEVVQQALQEALADSEVQRAFLELFSEEERSGLGAMDSAELAEAVGQALREEGTFHQTVAEEVLGWASQVSVSIPGDEESLDAFVSDWQLADGPTQASEGWS